MPPALPALHHDLSLSFTAAGLLTSVPVLILGLGAVPGAFLVSRVGARRAVAYGLALITAGAALRGVFPLPVSLFAFTAVLATGIALSQPALPTLVQAWFPTRIGRVTAIYSNGLLVGEVLAATLTLPLLLGRLHLGWQGALAAWALPAAATFLVWLRFAPGWEATAGVAVRWFPEWRSGRTLRIGFLMGGASVVYYGMNTWIPDTLEVRGGHDLITVTLGLLNFMQVPVSLALAVAGDALVGRRWPYLLAGGMGVIGVLGYGFGPVWTAPAWAGLLGAAASTVFILNLGLPALLEPSQVAAVSGFMFTIGYASAFFGPALGGIAWDLTGRPVLSLLPMAVASAVVIGLALGLPQAGRAAGGVSTRLA